MIYIRNAGEIELGALVLLGASTKDGDSSKIGFFGSGNKYAIATLLRKGIEFEIWSGTRKIEITTKTISLRGVDYEQIVIDGDPTSLTTRMGPAWETWFAMREFVCNAIDEGGYEMGGSNRKNNPPEEGFTTIYVHENDEVKDFYNNLNRYILSEDPILTRTLNSGLHNGLTLSIINNKSHDGKMNVYRKGISVIGTMDRESLWSYNFSSLSITESRTIANDWELRRLVATAMASLEDEDMIIKYVKERGGKYEEDLYWAEHIHNDCFTDSWEKALTGKRIAPVGVAATICREDWWAYHFVQDSLFPVLKSRFPNLLYFGGGSNDGWEEQEADDDEWGKVEVAKGELQSLNFDVSVPIKLGRFIEEDKVAEYIKSIPEIRISRDRLDDEEDLQLTIMEEMYHHRGHDDGSRSFELFLMGELLKSWRYNGRGVA